MGRKATFLLFDPFDSDSLITNNIHEKLLLVDGKKAVIGGRNISKYVLEAKDFEFLKGITKVSMIYGTEDELLTDEMLSTEKKQFYKLFGEDAKIIPFNGKHEVDKQVLKNIIAK